MVFSSSWRASVRSRRTPEFRKASSRKRCSSLSQSNSVILKVSGLGRKVTFVPFFSPAGPTIFSGASASPVAEAHPMLLAVAPDGELEPFGKGVHDRNADAVETAETL
jgi:hypothetical protein